MGTAVSRESGTRTSWLVLAGLGLALLAAVGSSGKRGTVDLLLPGLAGLMLFLFLPIAVQAVRSLRLRHLRSPRRHAPAVRAAIDSLAATGRLDLAVELGRFRLSIRTDDDESRILTADCVLRSGDSRLAAAILNGLPASPPPEIQRQREDLEGRIRGARL